MTNYHIPLELIMKFEAKVSDKGQMEKIAKSFIYDDKQSISYNLKSLGDQIVEYLSINGPIEGTLREFLNQKNIPIEVNFKPLKGDQLKNIIEQWLSFYTETSTIIQKLYTNNHRNILFKRVLLEQKETITDYFSTLSEKNMLKAVDLYQLLVDILSNYFLYEYNSDADSFFQKINSFNSFVDIVEKFVNSPKRIALGNTSQDFDYVRRIQFQRLMSFWEEENNELTLLSEKRINKIETEIQTTLVNMAQEGTQTVLENIRLMEFVNNSLKTLNILTASTQNSRQLIVIENLYSNLRKAKINLLDNNRQLVDEDQNDKLFKSAQLKIDAESDLNSNECSTPNPPADRSQTVCRRQKPQQLLELIDRSDLQFQIARTVSPPKNVKDVLERIYHLYKEFSGFSTQTLERCFIDIGIIERKNDPLTFRLMARKMITNRHDITYLEFKMIFQYLMQTDKDLTIEVLEEFMKSKNRLRLPIPSSTVHASYGDRNRKASMYTSRNYFGRYVNSSMYQ